MIWRFIPMISAIASLVQIVAAPCVLLHPAKDEDSSIAISARQDAAHEEEALLPDTVSAAAPEDAPTSIFAPEARKGTLVALAAMLLQQLSGESIGPSHQRAQAIGTDQLLGLSI